MVVASTGIHFQNILQIGQIHFVLNQLSWTNHGELVMRVEDQLPNAILFIVGIDWYGPIVEYLKKGYFEHDIPKEEISHIIVKYRPYALYDGNLYKLGLDNVLWQCLSPTKTTKVFVC